MNVVQFSHDYELETRVAMPIMRLLSIDLRIIYERLAKLFGYFKL